MSEEEKKNRKKAFIKWLISSLCLTGGASTGILATSENEEKIEESEGEENQKTTGGESVVKQTTKKPVDSKVELNTAFTDLNLGTIVTNGQDLNEQMIKAKLQNKIKDSKKTNIDSIEFIEIKNESANIKYKYQSVLQR